MIDGKMVVEGNPYHEPAGTSVGGRFARKPGGAGDVISIQTPAGVLRVTHDSGVAYEDAESNISEWSKNIPEHIWRESRLQSVHLMEDPGEVNHHLREKHPTEYSHLSEDDVVVGMYDGNGNAVVSRWCDLDMYGGGDGNSGRNFYHEFAHSTTYDGGIDWMLSRAHNEWNSDSVSERFAVAFSDYMVAKHYYEKMSNKGRYGNETYMEELRRRCPETVKLFEEWGL